MKDFEREPVIQALIDARKERKMTQHQLADAAGISRRALVAIEGGGDCNVSTLRRLLRALDLELTSTPATYNPPTLEDMMAENEQRYQQAASRKKS